MALFLLNVLGDISFLLFWQNRNGGKRSRDCEVIEAKRWCNFFISSFVESSVGILSIRRQWKVNKNDEIILFFFHFNSAQFVKHEVLNKIKKKFQFK